MDLDRASLAVIGAAATDLGRYAMRTMELRADSTVCTDGRIAVRVKHPDRVLTDIGPELKEPVLIDTEDVKALAANLSKKKTDPECFKRVGLDAEAVNVDPGHATFSVPVAGTRTDVVVKTADGTFPPVDDLTPDSKRFDAGVILSIDYMKRLIKIIEEVEKCDDSDDKAKGSLRLKLYGVKPGEYTTCAVRIDAARGRFVGIQMPISAAL